MDSRRRACCYRPRKWRRRVTFFVVYPKENASTASGAGCSHIASVPRPPGKKKINLFPSVGGWHKGRQRQRGSSRSPGLPGLPVYRRQVTRWCATCQMSLCNATCFFFSSTLHALETSYNERCRLRYGLPSYWDCAVGRLIAY